MRPDCRILRGVLFSLALAGLLLGSANAQEVTANIIGTVTDSTGASVGGAKVTVTATARNQVVRNLETNAEGLYAATLLPVGEYSVSVEAKGFRKATQNGIGLTANQKFTADFKLEVGDVSQSITVEAPVEQVELQTSQQSGLISGTQVRELSLNNRHFAQLVALQPGVSSNLSDQIYMGATNPTGGQNIVGLSINGTRQSQQNWTVDGADNVDRGANITINMYPSIDAIDEIKIVRSPYSAEFGRAGGGQISVITKSGTNELHGSGYEFFRNDWLNANNFFNNLNNNPRPPLRYNDFGYTVGGPVFLPRVYNGKNKTFFFFSEEFRRVINYNAQTVLVPNANELRGIFPNPVCTALSADFTTCTATGTQITNINPVAQEYVQDIFSKIPVPTVGNNLYNPVRGIFNARQELVRIDHNFSEKLALSGRYLHDSIPTVEPFGYGTNLATPNVATTSTNSPGWSLVIRGTSSLSATWYNEVGWAWSHGGIFSHSTGLMNSTNSPDIKPNLVFPANPERVPGVTFTGGLDKLSSFGPYNNFSYNHSIFDNMTKVFGRHTLKFGGAFYYYRKNENQLADDAGVFTFGNTPRPGNNVTLEQSWAYFLIGAVSNYSQPSQDLTADFRTKTFEGYIQDDFRVRSNLTINLGLRYSNYRQPTSANGLLTSFDPLAFDPSKAFQIDPTSGNRIAGTGDPYNGIIQGGKNSPFGNAIATQRNLDFAPRVGFAWDPFGTGKTSVRAGYGIFYDTTLLGFLETALGANPTTTFTQVNIANTSFSNPGSAAPSVSLVPPSPRGWDPQYHDPYIQQWSFEIQRQITNDSMFTIGYVGTKGTHLIGAIDINEAPPGAAAAAGLFPASGYITSALRPRLNILRPYRGYNAVNMVESWFNSNYNGLQTSFTKRFGKNGTLGVAYTWSKNITDNNSDRSNAPANSYNWKDDRGLATLDRRHVLTASYVYPLPFFKDNHGPAGYALGGWELSGIYSWNTGLPGAISSSTGLDAAGLGAANNASSLAGYRPDVVGDPNSGANIRNIYRWFNTAAFAEVPAGANRPGNSGRFIIETPAISRWDFSLFKQFHLKERVNLQVRGESFNVLNHANFNAPTTTFGSPNFGKILGARDPRQIQLGAKVVF